jgi:secreted trypsin-like serine protease
VSLQAVVTGYPTEHFCGGTLFDSRTVITAAHCCAIFYQLDSVEVVAGELLLDSVSGHEQRRKMISYKRHECKLCFVAKMQINYSKKNICP